MSERTARPRGMRRSIPLRWRLSLLVLGASAPFIVLISFAARTQLGARAIAWGAFALVLALALAMWQAQRLITPLRKLADHARDLARGDLARRSRVEAPDELRELAITMDHMASALADREKALASSESRYRALFDLNPSPMFVFDVETFLFRAVNQAAIDSYGYTREEFLSMAADQIRPADDPQDFHDFIENVHGRTVHANLRRHVKKDGSIIQVEVYSREIEFDGRLCRLAVANDVTEKVESETALRAAEERLVRSQRMEAIGQLTGGIAHDFNNILMAIRSYGELLLAALPDGDERRDDVLEIMKAQERASTLTRQLLAFSRSQVLQPRVINVNSIIDDLVAFIERLLGVNVRLVVQPAPTPVLVRADPSQLTQVFMNLAVNARDAMPGGGVLRITVSTHDVLADEAREGAAYTILADRYARIDVTDTGIGIPPDMRTKIFEPFFTTKPVGQGTGMGLSTVYGIVKQSGGYILVNSAPGEGTTFSILLPLAAGTAEAQSGPAREEPQGGGTESVLVVEDEAPLRNAISRMLREAGYRVFAADDGYDALGLLADEKAEVDLVVTDLVMPNMGGMELVDRLEQRGPIRVIYMTGYTKDAALRQEVRPGSRVLQKPFTRAELLKEVREALEADGARI